MKRPAGTWLTEAQAAALDGLVDDTSILGKLLAMSDVSDFDRTKHSLEFIGQEVFEIDKHFHNVERWCGQVGGWNGTATDDSADPTSLTPFQIDAGNDDFGSGLIIMGTEDSPIQSGMTKWDPHRIEVHGTERNVAHRLRVSWGAVDHATAVAAGDYTDVDFMAVAGQTALIPIDVRTPRLDTGVMLFAAIWALGANTGTFDFTIGIHEYAR